MFCINKNNTRTELLTEKTTKWQQWLYCIVADFSIGKILIFIKQFAMAEKSNLFFHNDNIA